MIDSQFCTHQMHCDIPYLVFRHWHMQSFFQSFNECCCNVIFIRFFHLLQIIGVKLNVISLLETLNCECKMDNQANVSTVRQFIRKLRSEEHTSELQSRFDLVCRLLLEKKNTNHRI